MVQTVASGPIRWIASLDDALTRAKTSGKLVLLDFFSPT